MKEKLYFKNSQGIRLCAVLSNPTNNKEKSIIVLCHGFSTSKDGRTYTRLEDILTQRDLSTFRLDFFGHGESEGKFEDITTSEAVDDVLSAIRFLKDSGYVKIGLMGSSFGGLASILAAAKSKEPYVLALKSPVSNHLEVLSNRFTTKDREYWRKKGFVEMTGVDDEWHRLNYSFYEDAERIDGYEAAQKIRIPTLIVHGDEDETVPLKQSKKTAGLIANCRLEIIKGADHTYSKDEHFERMLKLISEFIVENS